MESYEVFIQRHISQLRQHNIKSPVQHQKYLCKTNDKCRSEITFYGCAILSPLLSLEQREEMCRYRAKCLMSEKTMNSHTIRTSVQINPSPTLKEFILGQEVSLNGNTSRISNITENSGNKQEVKKYTCSPILSPTGLTDDWEVEDLRYPFIWTACDVSVIVASHEGKPVHTISQGPSIMNHVQMDRDTLEEYVDGSQQAHTDQTSCLSIVCPSEGPWKQQTLMQSRSTELHVVSSADDDDDDDSLSDKENEEVSKEDFMGRGEHLRANRKRQEQGRVPTPEPEKGQFDCTQQIISSENLCESRGYGSFQVNLINDEQVEGSFECENVKAKMKMSSRLKLVGNKKDFTPAFSCSPRKSSCFFRKKSSGRGTQRLSFTTETYKNVPVPQFSLSPVNSKKGDGVNPSRKQEINKSLHNESKGLLSWNDSVCWGSGNKSVVTRDITLGRSFNQTQQIAQLELNLSSLKTLISDLESSLSETQTDSEESTEAFTYSCHDHSSPVVIKKSRVNRNANHTTHSFLKQPVIVSGYEAIPESDHELLQLHQAIPQNAFQVAIGECQKPLLGDVSSKSEQEKNILKMAGPKLDVSMNQSYDVESPSGLLLQAQISGGKQFTQCPDSHGVFFHTKRRLIMKAVDSNSSASADQRSGIIEKSSSSTIKGAVCSKASRK
ncbi:hypothetical protein AALO_G00119660 [Alosa alosa]|uniref:Uncharacterized protein n=2 Tax=Alosa alosa TaxID=278164 RepID=A0AAV6GKE2_9TELE|nr:uncharacterized protein si:ch73-100l22.3 isoform X1 [Alosa alosa]KAG5275385.1 hypothetical protein AALO_G00119660 [Alosa alosa]